MRLPYFDFQEPSTPEEALSVMAFSDGEARPLAGGTDLIPLMKYGLDAPSVIVSLKRTAGLRGIRMERNELHIGAMTLLSDIVASPVIRENFRALHQAAEAVATPSIWNVATLGGNICQNSRCLYYNQSGAWRLERPPCFKAGGRLCHAVPKGKKCFSVYSGDLAPALIALKGKVSIRTLNESRTVPTREALHGQRSCPSRPREGRARDRPCHSCLRRKKRLRVCEDAGKVLGGFPLLSAAASVTVSAGRRIEELSLVLGAVGPAPVTVTEADRLLKGLAADEIDPGVLDEHLRKKTRMVDNLTLPGSYRRKMLPVIAGKAIRAAFEAVRMGKEAK